MTQHRNSIQLWDELTVIGRRLHIPYLLRIKFRHRPWIRGPSDCQLGCIELLDRRLDPGCLFRSFDSRVGEVVHTFHSMVTHVSLFNSTSEM